MIFIVNFFSPLLMTILATCIFFITKRIKLKKADGKYLCDLSIKCAAICAGISLGFTVVSMELYEISTGYCAGNGPLGWIFLYGPPSAALGQLIALVLWWFKKPHEISNKKNPNKSLENRRA